jgi:hypothetical protein
LQSRFHHGCPVPWVMDLWANPLYTLCMVETSPEASWSRSGLSLIGPEGVAWARFVSSNERKRGWFSVLNLSFQVDSMGIWSHGTVMSSGRWSEVASR